MTRGMTRGPGILALMAIVLGIPFPALAAGEREAGEYYLAVTPIVGYRLGGDISAEDGEDLSVDDDSLVGLIFNLPAGPVEGEAYTEWELYLSRQTAGIDRAPSGVDANLELDISHVLLGGTYVGAGRQMRPFLAAGLGVAHLSPDAPGYSSDTVFAFTLGGGAQLFPARRVGVRLEGRMLGAVIDSDSALFCASGPEGSACAFRTSGEVLWQWEATLGVTARF